MAKLSSLVASLGRSLFDCVSMTTSQFSPSLSLTKKRSEVVPAVPRINVTELYPVREWATHYGCTPGQLRAAVSIVGNIAADVEKHLRPAPTETALDRRRALDAAFKA
jgi:hypothetical protein